MDSVGGLWGSPLRSHVSCSLDGDERESFVLSLEPGDLLVELPWSLVELSLVSELGGELLSHHEVASHVSL